MKKSKILLLAMCVLMLVGCFTGCGKKTAITDDDFRTIANDNGLSIIDATEQFPDSLILETASIAKSDDDWQIEFYVLTDSKAATGMFNTNKENFENLKGNASFQTSVAIGNHAVYSLVSNGTYMHVSRIDNTVVYVNEDAENKDAIDSVLKKMGY